MQCSRQDFFCACRKSANLEAPKFTRVVFISARAIRIPTTIPPLLARISRARGGKVMFGKEKKIARGTENGTRGLDLVG